MLRALSIPLCLALISARPAFAQPTSEATVAVAHVYVGTLNKEVEMYDAASNGELTLVKGSPFRTGGIGVGSNGKYFISLGTDELYSNLVETGGTIGKQVSALNFKSYKGANCGSDGGYIAAELDNTGQNVYVLSDNVNLPGGSQCTAILTFDIAKGTGTLEYRSTLMVGGNNGILLQLPSIITNNIYGYATNAFGCCEDPPAWSGFKRESNGELENHTFTSNFPHGGYVPYYVTAGPGNFLAVLTATNSGPDEYGPEQLASYTVDSNGNISTTNSANEMPVVTGGDGSLMSFSPAGDLIAIAGYSSGLQIFHFNGTHPLTTYSERLYASSGFSSISWDRSNHLYALSFASGKKPGQLFVHTITPTSITSAHGSPHEIINSPQSLVVVPTT
jgi:hypothetical protein